MCLLIRRLILLGERLMWKPKHRCDADRASVRTRVI